MRRGDVLFLVAVMFMAGFILGSYFSYDSKNEVVRYVLINTSFNGTSVEMAVPAVDQLGNGVAVKLVTTIKPGSGFVLVNVNDVFAQPLMELSGRVAAASASRFTNISLENIDIIYSVVVNASSIEGPSAGAAMAISIIAGLTNKTLSKGVMITGTVTENGTIGQVGGIFEKAAAAKETGIKTLLVPKGQSLENNVFREKNCRAEGSAEYCSVRYVLKTRNTGDVLGISIVEVADIEEAIEYFEKE